MAEPCWRDNWQPSIIPPEPDARRFFCIQERAELHTACVERTGPVLKPRALPSGDAKGTPARLYAESKRGQASPELVEESACANTSTATSSYNFLFGHHTDLLIMTG